MKTFLIVNKQDLSIAARYEAEQAQPWGGPWGDAEQFAHLEVEEGHDLRAVEAHMDEEDGLVLVENQDAKDALAAADQKKAIEALVAGAIAFGNALMIEFAAQNVGMGITQDSKTADVRRAMANVLNALQTGSLYDAIAEARAIAAEDKDDKYITDERLLAFVNKIEARLGLDASEEL